MDRDYIARLYDDEYAASYDEKFFDSPLCQSDTKHQLELIKQFLAGGGTWLDVECCTGYFLRHFPHVERAGMEISPAMLRVAREGNPGVPLLQHDFRDPLLSLENRWDLVTCMWYNYGLVDTMDELDKVIHNMWSWTSPAGTCFMPLGDPRLIAGVNLPYIAPTPWEKWGGRVQVTGIVWSYVEEDGRKVHSHMMAPNLEYIIERFQIYFGRVEIIRHPPVLPGWEGHPALVASEKKSLAHSGAT